MPKSDMHQAYIRSLMYLIGGMPRPGGRDKWLDDMSKTTGIGSRSLLAAYSGQWISKNKYVSDRTLEILRQVAENAKQSSDLVAFVELQITIWETAPELFQRRIEMAREFVAQLRHYDAERIRSRVPAHDDAGVATLPAGYGATAKT
jgi:hypothetical protein